MTPKINFTLQSIIAVAWLLLTLVLLAGCDDASSNSAATTSSNSNPTNPASPRAVITLAPGVAASTDRVTPAAITSPTQPAISPTSAPPETASLPAPATFIADNAGLKVGNDLYIGETGHYIKDQFATFWQTRGGAAVLGNPLSEAYTDANGRLVQLFEQSLLEYHPEAASNNNQIQLGFLGRQLAEAQGLLTTNPAFAHVAPSDETDTTRLYFAQTGHNLVEPIKSFWETNALLKFLGYPISEELTQDGLRVQYFERGLLEYAPATRQVEYTNSGDLLLAAYHWPAPAKFSLKLTSKGLEIVQGQPLVVQLTEESLTNQGRSSGSAQLSFDTYNVKFENITSGSPSGTTTAPTQVKVFEAFVPAGLSLQPKNYPLIVTLTDYNGILRMIGRTIKVNQGNFGTQDLTLDGDLSDLSDHSADEYDDAQLDSTYHTFSPTLLWKGNWHWPLNIAWTLTTDFAERRTYNGKLDTLYFHGGLDMAPDSGRSGDPVLAPADGKVIYTGQLKARGITIAIDHGLGVTSYYFHLSGLAVSVGQSVRTGDRLGLVGDTGRATGPHLHWEVRVQGSIIDPRSFLKQDLSKLP